MKHLISTSLLILAIAQSVFAKAPCNSGSLTIDTLSSAQEKESIDESTIKYSMQQSKRAKLAEIAACSVNCNRSISTQEFDFFKNSIKEEKAEDITQLLSTQQEYILALQDKNLDEDDRESYEWAISDINVQVKKLKKEVQTLTQNVLRCL